MCADNQHRLYYYYIVYSRFNISFLLRRGDYMYMYGVGYYW